MQHTCNISAFSSIKTMEMRNHLIRVFHDTGHIFSSYSRSFAVCFHLRSVFNASHSADAPLLGVVGGKSIREPRIRLRSQRSERLYRRSLQRSAVASALGIALKYSPRPFGNDALRVAAVTATAVIDRLRIVAEADDCAVANRADLTRRHGCPCSGPAARVTPVVTRGLLYYKIPVYWLSCALAGGAIPRIAAADAVPGADRGIGNGERNA